LNEELFRPFYHFTPAENWMNDPNGMVYYAGEYHLFYQYHPYSTEWGPMHWGHAVSTDMLNWQHLPIALSPDEHGAIFSGSVVIDSNNTSGLGSTDKPAMVALFTYHNAEMKKAGARNFQTQGLAYSVDKGRTWVKYKNNPVMENPDLIDFRDPRVSWYAPQEKWLMVVTQGDNIGFYSSKDLIDWQALSSFGKGIGEHSGVWECPDFIPIKIAGTAQSKYVLLVSIMPGAPNGGSGTQYFVGDFDGKDFVVDPEFAVQLQEHNALWLDYGTDNYAGVTFSGVPESDGRTLFMGWMNNWLYATKVPTEKWRGSMTIPRTLSLQEVDEGLKLISRPVKELKSISNQPADFLNIRVNKDVEFSTLFGPISGANRLSMIVTKQGANSLELTYSNHNQQQLVISLDITSGAVTIDRSRSGTTDFAEHFAKPQVGKLRPNLDSYSFDVFYDMASIEVFINDGELSMTALAFPTSPYNKIQLKASHEVLLNKVTMVQLKNE
jgi:fructan beta-fructosidase